MAKTAWPDNTALTNRLTGLGVTTVPTGVTLADKILQAVEKLEDLSGQSPFLVEATNQTYNFDPSRRLLLDLKVSWVSIETVVVDGTTLTVNEDYWLQPYGGPYTFIEFNAALVSNGDPQTCVVTGKRGYAAQIPEEAYQAVLDWAAGEVYETAAMAGTVSAGTPTEVKMETVTVKYGSSSSSGGGTDTGKALKAKAEEVFWRLRRPSVGGV